MRSRNRRVWAVFALGLLTVLAVMTWVTAGTLRRIEEQGRDRAQIDRQEALRTALWRLDTAILPLVVQETLRSIPFGNLPPDSATERFVLARFREEPSGAVTVLSRGPAFPEDGQERLEGLAPFDRVLQVPAPEMPVVRAPEQSLYGFNGPDPDPDSNRNQGDFNSRLANNARSQVAVLSNFMVGDPSDFSPLTAAFLEGSDGRPELVLARRGNPDPRVGGGISGSWIDWSSFEAWLRAEVADLLPEARLLPITTLGADPADTSADRRDRLASLPVRIDVASPLVADRRGGAEFLPLVLAWVAVLLALGALAAVTARAVTIGERRGHFVAAVTHELRSPLTTFRLYAQMLADGMVEGEAARSQYLGTLCDESERLCRVVESVLLWSRLEAGAPRPRLALGDALQVLEDRLPAMAARAAASGMHIESEFAIDAGVRLAHDPQLLEQILLNLVDNSCKYAVDPTLPEPERRLRFEARVSGPWVEIHWRDFGPGIAAADRDRIFEPFRRAPRHEAGAAPGLGIGLPLARGLARAQGGDLDLLPNAGPGATFRLRLERR